MMSLNTSHLNSFKTSHYHKQCFAYQLCILPSKTEHFSLFRRGKVNFNFIAGTKILAYFLIHFILTGSFLLCSFWCYFHCLKKYKTIQSYHSSESHHLIQLTIPICVSPCTPHCHSNTPAFPMATPWATPNGNQHFCKAHLELQICFINRGKTCLLLLPDQIMASPAWLQDITVQGEYSKQCSVLELGFSHARWASQRSTSKGKHVAAALLSFNLQYDRKYTTFGNPHAVLVFGPHSRGLDQEWHIRSPL